MNRRSIYFLLVFILFLTRIDVSAQSQMPILTDSVFTKYNEVNLTSPDLWRFIPGDDIDTLGSNFLMENWKPANIILPKNDTPMEWNGSGWFSTIIKIDSTLFGKEMAIRGHIRGAMEFYVNGVLLETVGVVGENKDAEVAAGFFQPIRFTFNSQPDQLIAIKYSNHTARSFFNKERSGLELYIGYPKNISTTNEFVQNLFQKQTNRFHLIFGFIVALGFLHLFLFIFYPSDRANLTCAFFFFSISGIFLSGIIFDSMASPSQFINYTFGEGLAITLTSIILPFLIYQLINRNFDWIPFLILAAGIFVLIFHFINPVAFKVLYYLFFLTSIIIGIVIMIYTRFREKMKALNIILLFYLIALILLFPSLIQISFGWEILWYSNTMLMNLSAIPVAVGYSFYLARGVAITNKQLKEKLKENEFLSNEKLKAESEKKQLIENQKNNLENEVKERTADLQKSLHDLKATQAQLIQSEKMASLGELTAGIAHEIQNPLNFVNNFSEVSNELIDEMNDELDKGDIEEAKAISADIKKNLEKINHHGKRADGIVKGMLAHSRSSKGEKVPTDINALADEYLRLSYHGLKAKDKNFNADFSTDLDPTLPKVKVIPQDIGRVLLNLINNAFQAVNGIENPKVVVATKPTENGIEITVSDNGSGIPEGIKDKIFQPFFTTKPTGQGTGLGLSLSYDIVKAHGGELIVETKEYEGTKFSLLLPL